MVARWDLGIEVPIQKLPIYQSEIVNKSKTLGKFVIIATHLLETMIQNPFPTRAESSDIFNSVLQWPDALMLSWETTTWKFPIESAQMMTKIIKEAEIHSPYTYSQYSNNWLNERNIEKKTLISSWIELWQELQAEALIVMTKTWLLARLTWAFHPNIPVFAFTNSKQSLWIMRLYYGINPIYLKWWDQKDYSKTLDKAISYLLEKEFISKKAKIIAITDLQKWKKEIPVLEIINVKELFL
jgi:pyruvate kinase